MRCNASAIESRLLTLLAISHEALELIKAISHYSYLYLIQAFRDPAFKVTERHSLSFLKEESV